MKYPSWKINIWDMHVMLRFDKEHQKVSQYNPIKIWKRRKPFSWNECPRFVSKKEQCGIEELRWQQ